VNGNIQFPCHKERKNLLANSAVLEPIERILPGSRELLVSNVQPYEAGSGADIFVLHQLDIIDKHKEILVATALSGAGPLIICVDGKPQLSARSIRFNPKKPLPIASSYVGEVTVHHDVHASLQVLFDQVGFFQNKPIGQSLIHLSKRVAEIIGLFAALI
jgi:hypothetical protein